MNLAEALRDIFSHTPTSKGWKNLCQILGTGPLEPWILDYASKHLKNWPDELKIAPKHWNQALVDNAPLHAWSLVRSVVCEKYQVRRVVKLLKNERMKHITSLTFLYGKLSPKSSIKALTQSPNLTSIHTLKLLGCILRDDGAKAIFHSPLGSQLHTLHFKAGDNDRFLSTMMSTGDSISGLTTAHNMTKLRHLVLEGPFEQLLPQHMRDLGSTPHLQSLESLGVHRMHRAEELLTAISFDTLHTLDLHRAYAFNYATINRFPDAPLKTLILGSAHIGYPDIAISHICKLPLSKSLTSLSLLLDKDVNLEHLMNAPWATQLKKLNIDIYLTEENHQLLAEHPALSNLTSLILGRNFEHTPTATQQPLEFRKASVKTAQRWMTTTARPNLAHFTCETLWDITQKDCDTTLKAHYDAHIERPPYPAWESFVQSMEQQANVAFPTRETP